MRNAYVLLYDFENVYFELVNSGRGIVYLPTPTDYQNQMGHRGTLQHKGLFNGSLAPGKCYVPGSLSCGLGSE